jgi:hypothetical protein
MPRVAPVPGGATGYEPYRPRFRDHIREDRAAIIGPQNASAREGLIGLIRDWWGLPAASLRAEAPAPRLAPEVSLERAADAGLDIEADERKVSQLGKSDRLALQNLGKLAAEGRFLPCRQTEWVRRLRLDPKRGRLASCTNVHGANIGRIVRDDRQVERAIGHAHDAIKPSTGLHRDMPVGMPLGDSLLRATSFPR